MNKWHLPPSGGHMESASKIYLQNMTGKQVEERLKKNDVIIIPIGSTEAHGPHAPYGEDTFLVTRMSEMVAENLVAFFEGKKPPNLINSDVVKIKPLSRQF